MNSKEGLVVIDNLKTEFGKRETIGYAKIYETEERAKQVERPHITERNTFVAPEEAKKEA
jgi:small subunit ribosomal protein S24e